MFQKKNMSLQGCVERLFTLNSNYLHAEQAFNQAASLQTLSDDLYTDPFRFVYELVQNADDAASTHLQIALIDNNYLIVSHNGKIFDEKDVCSLCAVNNSTKTRDNQTAGYKGLGFKAIFGKSDYVLIITNGDSFRFDAKYKFKWIWTDVDQKTWESNNKRKFIYPWQICPIWTENQEIHESIRTWFLNSENKMRVNIIIRLHNVNETRDALRELAAQPHTFLFLRNIRHVKFLGMLDTSKIRIEQQADGSRTLHFNNGQRSQWLVSQRKIRVQPEVLKDTRLPEKLSHVQSTEIGLAAQLDVNNRKMFIPVSNNDNVLFAYMPTKISKYNLPLLISANFLTNANREQIHIDSIWNQWLFECIPRETINWVKELVEKSYWGDTAYHLLPSRTQSRDILTNKYNESCSTALQNTKFIRNALGQYLTPNEAIIDLTRLSDQSFIGIEPIWQFIRHKYNIRPEYLSSNLFISDHPRLRDLGVRIFDWENAIDMLNSREFQTNFSINHAIELISYLFNHKDDEEISRLLYQIPFIMDRNKHLQILGKIYFPSQFNDENWNSPDCQESYVHDDIMRKLQPPHRQWLEQRGVSFKTDLTFFHRTIIPNASIFITFDNALPTIQRLFHLYVHGQISADDLKRLMELSLLTNANTLVPANRLYLSFAYQPYLPLDTQLPKVPHLFVSSSYIQNIPCLRWREFFLLLGVQENIGLITLNNDCRFFQNYHEDQMKIIFGLNSQQVHRYKYQKTIQFLEFTEDNFHFARSFWDYVIRTINVGDLNQPEIAYWGALHKRGATEGTEVYTFPQWFVSTRPCIPVQILSTNDTYQIKCLKGPNVYTNQLSPWIGRYLPIFECTPNAEPLNYEWIKFFRLKTELTIDDHFSILHQIYVRNQTEIDVEDDRRIQNLYANLLKILFNIDINQRQLYREKCQSKNICLLSEHDRFMPPEELNVWSIDTFPPPSELHILKLNLKNRRHANLADLLYVLNVNKIEKKDLNLIPINANPCDDLTNCLQKSYLSLLFDHHKITNKDKLNELDNIKFFEADRLDLYTTNSNIFVGNTPVYDKNNCLYITKPWNSDLIRNQLSIKICELLGLSTDIFKTHACTLLTTSSIENDFIQLGIFRKDNDSLNDQSTNLIERDNLELFNRLEHLSSSYTPAELLIAGLEAQNSDWTGYIYHYTHLENAVSILRDQTLKSRHLLQTNNFKDSSAYDFMSQTDDQVNHYVRFYFRPLTLTQFHNENLGSEKINNYTPMCPVPIFFCINLRAIFNIPNLIWKVSLGDMSKHRSEYDCTLDVIKQFDFCGLFKKLETERGQRSAQLEFLIENQLDFKDLSKDAINLIYQNFDAKESLECILKEESNQIYSSEIKMNYFFGENNRIFINHDHEQEHISVWIVGKIPRKNDMLIVQIKLNENEEKIDVACYRNICAVFHHDHITTIYGKGKFDIFVGKRAYAVYYKYQEQSWLIYTNHNKPEFDNSHIQKFPGFIPYD